MNKAVIATVVIVLAALVGGVVYLAQREDTPDVQDAIEDFREDVAPGLDENGNDEDEEAAAATHTVTFNGTAFSPAELIVSLGDTVVFRNESSVAVHIASDPHPTHTDYPQFDSRRSIAAGDEYRFTFERAGTWGYHNHLNPVQTGTVIVEE